MALEGGSKSKAKVKDTNFDAVTASVFAHVFDLYGKLTPDGSVIDLAGQIFERTGTNPELLIGHVFSQTVFWQSSEDTSKILEKAISQTALGENQRLILNFRISADEKTAIEINLIPVEKNGKVESMFVCGLVFEDRVENVANLGIVREQLISVAENADIGLWFWDFSDDTIHSTPRCNELFEIPASEQLTFERFIEVVHPNDRRMVKEFIREARERGSRYSEEFRVQYADGTVEWIAAEGRSILDGAEVPQRMTGTIRKITEQKLATVELSRVNDLVKKARDEAVEANRGKDFFLAFVSHEIRSSLNAIIGWSRILLTKEVDKETYQTALETIERSARSQTKLINDLVDSARVASGKLRLEYRPTNICEVVKGSFETHRPAAEAAHIEYTFSSDVEDLTIVGDASRLHQVFGNLISNALKFTPNGGAINVTIKTGAEAVTINVEDNGKGIQADALPKVFRQFSQADGEGIGGNAGIGLGLSIVKILAERHGGHVRAQSRGLGKGSTFSVTLPIAIEQSLMMQSNPKIELPLNQKPLTGLEILIVEDNVDSREVLQMFLEKSGASVRSADSAKAAFNALTDSRTRLPDLLISDLAMPDEDGYSLVSRIRQLPEDEGGQLPAIALSAFANEESRRRAFDSGFHRYATKPFDHDLLINEILEAVRPAIPD
jgi:PAS domain S-box-containing protein